jgi:hypothetical protein
MIRGNKMKRAPTPSLPEGTPWERLDHAFRTVLTVSKEALLKEEARLKRLRQKKRAKKLA